MCECNFCHSADMGRMRLCMFAQFRLRFSDSLYWASSNDLSEITSIRAEDSTKFSQGFHENPLINWGKIFYRKKCWKICWTSLVEKVVASARASPTQEKSSANSVLLVQMTTLEKKSWNSAFWLKVQFPFRKKNFKLSFFFHSFVSNVNLLSYS